MNDTAIRELPSPLFEPVDATGVYIGSFVTPGTKLFRIPRILMSFLLPVAVPIAVLLRQWAPSQHVFMALCIGVLVWAVFLNLATKLYDDIRTPSTRQSSQTIHKSQSLNALQANIGFVILCALACSILLAPAAVEATAFTRFIAIAGGGYAMGAFLIGTVELAFRALSFIYVKQNTSG